MLRKNKVAAAHTKQTPDLGIEVKAFVFGQDAVGEEPPSRIYEFEDLLSISSGAHGVHVHFVQGFQAFKEA